MKTILFFLGSIFSYAAVAQIPNGGFQNGSSPSLSNWSMTCGAQSASTSPTGGGNWCIQVSSGNTQGCFPGYAYQKLPSISNGQTFTLSGWAYTQASPTVGIYFGKINNGAITLQAGITTTSTAWTQLQVQSSFSLATGDTAVVILHGGMTGGPVQGYGFFDLIDLQSIVTGINHPKQKQSFHIFPNPFSMETILEGDKILTDATLTLYDSQGQIIKQMSGISGKTITLQRSDLLAGLYFLQISEGDKTFVTDKIIITD